MPHLVVEVTKGLLSDPDVQDVLLTTLQSIHIDLVELGYAREKDMKSRIIVPVVALVGDDPSTQLIAATLTMTQPRPDWMRNAMGALIHKRLQNFIDSRKLTCKWQCCVFFNYVGSETYIKSASPAPIE